MSELLTFLVRRRGRRIPRSPLHVVVSSLCYRDVRDRPAPSTSTDACAGTASTVMSTPGPRPLVTATGGGGAMLPADEVDPMFASFLEHAPPRRANTTPSHRHSQDFDQSSHFILDGRSESVEDLTAIRLPRTRCVTGIVSFEHPFLNSAWRGGASGQLRLHASRFQPQLAVARSTFMPQHDSARSSAGRGSTPAHDIFRHASAYISSRTSTGDRRPRPASSAPPETTSRDTVDEEVRSGPPAAAGESDSVWIHRT
jgi:hypothetical protein